MIEAIAAWTESLRDTAGAAAGLEQAIPATVTAAHPLLRRPLRELAARLDGRVPLPEALARFADDVDDPAADLVVAALTLNARQRAGGLDRILTSLAASSRAELEMRRNVELERRSLRRQAQRIAGAVDRLRDPPSTVRPRLGGAVLLTGRPARARGTDGAVPGRVRPDAVLGRDRTEPRFLTSADEVTEIASYKPRLATRSLPSGVRLMIAFMLASGILAAALLHAYRLAVPPRTDLVTAVGRWDTPAREPPGSSASAQHARFSDRPVWGRWLAEQLTPHPGPDRSEPGPRHHRNHAGGPPQPVLTSVLGLFGPIAILSSLNAAGAGVARAHRTAAGPGAQPAMVGLGHRELRETAAKRRAEFRRALSIYLDLVAMSMQAGRGHAKRSPPRPPSAPAGPSPISRTPSRAPASPASPPGPRWASSASGSGSVSSPISRARCDWPTTTAPRSRPRWSPAPARCASSASPTLEAAQPRPPSR